MNEREDKNCSATQNPYVVTYPICNEYLKYQVEIRV